MVIHTINDIVRPSNADGIPIEQKNSQLQVIINGNTYKWYTECDIFFNANTPTLGAQLRTSNYIFGKNNGTKQTIRVVAQISVSSNFSTYTQKIYEAGGGANYLGGVFYVYARTAADVLNEKTKIAHNRVSEAPGTGTFYGYLGAPSFDLQATNRQIWIRVKVQWKNNSGTWVDCSRGSGLSVWKTFTTYAPFYQSITAPTHFYGNGLNTFTCTIGANLISEFKNCGMKKTGSSNYSLSLKIVRNEIAPYITTGTATTNLYCWPYSVATDELSTYEFTLNLYVIDPSDSSVKILVASRTVTGNVEYKSTPDDISPIDGTPIWTVTDPEGYYEEYGVILKNIVSTITRTITVRSRYGRNIGVYYKDINNITKSSGITGDITSVTISENVDSAKYNTCPVGIYITDGNATDEIYNDITYVPIITYYQPSIPTFAIHRCDQDGTANDKGSYCKIDWSVVIHPINNLNSKKLVISHPSGNTIYDPLNNYSQGGSLIVEANTEYAYTITLALSDDFNTITRTAKLSTANVIMDWLYNGKGIGFGKVASKENTVEIAEDWKLLAYEMWINDIDVGALLKKLFSRILTLEQYATQAQSGQTQYVVTFYNDSAWLNRQWIRTGQNAIDPTELSQSWQRIETPSREPTETQTFQFLGWSRTNGATVADSTALENITANRTLYAVFASATRMYTVNFLNGSTPLQTENDLQYHYSTNYSGSDPVSDDGYTFVGWCPSGRIISGDTDAKAVFFNNTEITDDWKTIMQSVIDGTADKKYHVGQYKTLDCGSEGQIKVRIKGFLLYEMSTSKKKAKIAWEAIDCLATQRRMNPEIDEGVEGTGALGGWEKSELRQWLNGDFYNGIDPVVQSQIKSVKTVSYSIDASGASVANKVVTDKIFIPSCEEIVGHYRYVQRNYSDYFETEGIDFRYTNSSFGPVKKVQGTGTNAQYWLRTASKGTTQSGEIYHFIYFYNLANLLAANPSLEKYIAICFCT